MNNEQDIKEAILDALNYRSYNITDQAGNEDIVVEKSDFERIADDIIYRLLNMNVLIY